MRARASTGRRLRPAGFSSPGGRPAAGGETRFADRRDAGRRLGERVAALRLGRPTVMALPRGGVPVAYEVALELEAPLDVLVVRKIGAPGQPEFGVGAIAEGGAAVFDEGVIDAIGLSPEHLDAIVRAEDRELTRRVESYRRGRERLEVRDRDVVLVDDGLATGVSARAAVKSIRADEPRSIVLAVPVCAPASAARLRDEVDDLVCLARPPDFQAVGSWYADFDQTSDREVNSLLAAAAASTLRAVPK